MTPRQRVAAYSSWFSPSLWPRVETVRNKLAPCHSQAARSSLCLCSRSLPFPPAKRKQSPPRRNDNDRAGPSVADKSSRRAASRPFANASFEVKSDTGAVVAPFTTDSHGWFQIWLAAGHYTVAMKGLKPAIGHFWSIRCRCDREQNNQGRVGVRLGDAVKPRPNHFAFESNFQKAKRPLFCLPFVSFAI